jgi:hypothetical protein
VRSGTGDWRLSDGRKLAKEAVSLEQTHEFHALVSAQKRTNRERMIEEWQSERRSSELASIYAESMTGSRQNERNASTAHSQETERIS